MEKPPWMQVIFQTGKSWSSVSKYVSNSHSIWMEIHTIWKHAASYKSCPFPFSVSSHEDFILRWFMYWRVTWLLQSTITITIVRLWLLYQIQPGLRYQGCNVPLCITRFCFKKLYDKINANQTVSHCIPIKLKSEFSLRQPRRDREREKYILYINMCVMCVCACTYIPGSSVISFT